MESRKEHVRAHNYKGRRLYRAAVTGRPDVWEIPLRRTATGTTIGFFLALIIVAGFFLYGLFRPGGGPVLNSNTTVVVEKETGTRYIVDNGVLRPVANLSSAMMALGDKFVVQTLTKKRTATLLRGEPIGLIGAPDDVPSVTGVVQAGWSACILGTTSTSGVVPPLVITFGEQPKPTQLLEDQGLLVANPAGQFFVVANGTRHQVTSADARRAAGYDAKTPLRVPDPWLASLRPGRAIEVISVPGAGSAGPSVGGIASKVGQVLVLNNELSSSQYYLVRADKIVPVTKFEALMLLGNPALTKVNPDGLARRVNPGDGLAAAAREQLPQSLGWPSAPPQPVTRNIGDACVVQGAVGQPWVGLRPAVPVAVGSSGAVVVRVPPGSAVVAEAVDPAGGLTGRLSFIDDLGRNFAIPDVAVLDALKLTRAPRVPVPVGLLATISAGPVLDLSAVRAPAAKP